MHSLDPVNADSLQTWAYARGSAHHMLNRVIGPYRSSILGVSDVIHDELRYRDDPQ